MPLYISLSLVIEKLSQLRVQAPEFCGLAFLRLCNELHFVAPAFRTLAGVHQCQSSCWYPLCFGSCAGSSGYTLSGGRQVLVLWRQK